MPAAEADRISLTTIAELIRVAKDDHVAFVKRVADAVTAGEKLSPDSLSSPHHCRFGRWYDSVSDLASMALPSFKAVKAPHDAVHELGRRLSSPSPQMMACSSTLRRGGAEPVGEGDALSHEFGREYPATFSKQAA